MKLGVLLAESSRRLRWRRRSLWRRVLFLFSGWQASGLQQIQIYTEEMIEVYKYLHGIYSVPYDNLLKKALPSALRGHNYKLLKRHCHPQSRLQFFVFRVTNLELSSRRSGVRTIIECIQGKAGRLLGQLSVLSGPWYIFNNMTTDQPKGYQKAWCQPSEQPPSSNSTPS